MAHEKFTVVELEFQADSIMDKFNFEKVHAHMVATGHKWANGDVTEVPNREEIRSFARSLLVKAIYNALPVANVGSGGFVAYKLPWGLQLTFQLAWS
jgi:hypothetical protein